MDYHRSPELTSIYDSFITKIQKSKKYHYSIFGTNHILFSDIRSLIPGYVDDKYINPMYKKINEKIEKISPNYILFYQVPFPDNLPLLGGYTLNSFSHPQIS